MISLLIALVILGVVLYLIQTYIPMAPQIKILIQVIITIAVCVWLLNAFGVVSTGPYMHSRGCNL